MEITVDLSDYHMPTTDQFNTAMARAINHTTAKAITAGNKGITRVWNIKTKDIKGYEVFKRANKNNTTAILTFKSRSLSLIHFQARQLKRGASFKIKKSGGRTTLRHSFIATTRGGYVGVFKRKGKKSLPIETFKSITPTTMFKKDGVDDFNNVIDEDLKARLAHELARIRA